MDFKNLRVHVIGIGGIGVSGLARFLKAQGAVVSGSDIAYTSITQSLESESIAINIPHDSDAVREKDVIIHSAIIKDSNVELAMAKSLGKKILSRRDALLELLKDKRVISVCAAHGKSSTSAILASILPYAGAIIGAISKEFDSNVRVSSEELLVFEADESDKSFLNSNPYKSVVLNAEAEHLESYGHDFEKLKMAYAEFIALGKCAVLNIGCEVVREIWQNLDSKNLDSALTKISTFDLKRDVKNIYYTLKDSKPYTAFEFRDFGEFMVQGIGEHNAENAGVAILCALEFSDIESIRKNMLHFKGIKKRFDILQFLDSKTPCIIDDYAHHPTEIRATLSGGRIYSKLLFDSRVFIESSSDSRNRAGHDSLRRGFLESNFKHLTSKKDSIKITAIFQPHKYSRLRDNLEAFQSCFIECDELVILPVWAAGEAKIEFNFSELFKAYSPIFAKRVKRVGESLHLINQTEESFKILDSGIIIGLGAGDITYQLRGEM